MNTNKALAVRAKMAAFAVVSSMVLLVSPANAVEVTIDLPFTEATLSIEVCVTSGGVTYCDVVAAE